MNKIKNILILVVAFIATSVFAACNDDDDNVITSHVVLNPETVEFSADGGTQTVTANGNAPVKTITSDASWLKAEAGSFLPTKLTQPVILMADKNTTSSARTATVTITAGTLTLTIPVSQASGNGSTEDRRVVSAVLQWTWLLTCTQAGTLAILSRRLAARLAGNTR